MLTDSAEAAARAGLIGTWLLESCTMGGSGSSPDLPFGNAPRGAILYTADGWMACQMQGGDLQSAYSGPYSIDEEERTVTHRIAFSDSPLMQGDQLRHYEVDGNRLVLSASMQGSRIVVTWRRPGED